jgi:hypothetical protein
LISNPLTPRSKLGIADYGVLAGIRSGDFQPCGLQSLPCASNPIKIVTGGSATRQVHALGNPGDWTLYFFFHCQVLRLVFGNLELTPCDSAISRVAGIPNPNRGFRLSALVVLSDAEYVLVSAKHRHAIVSCICWQPQLSARIKISEWVSANVTSRGAMLAFQFGMCFEEVVQVRRGIQVVTPVLWNHEYHALLSAFRRKFRVLQVIFIETSQLLIYSVHDS